MVLENYSLQNSPRKYFDSPISNDSTAFISNTMKEITIAVYHSGILFKCILAVPTLKIYKGNIMSLNKN